MRTVLCDMWRKESSPYWTQQHFRWYKDEAATARSSAYAHWASCRKSSRSKFLGMNASWSHLKMGSEAIANEKPLWTSLSDSSGHKEQTPSPSHKINAHTVRQLSVLEYTKGILEWLTLGKAAAKSTKRTPDSCRTHAIWAKAVVSVYTSWCTIGSHQKLLPWASCNSIAQRQRAKGLLWSNKTFHWHWC